MHIKKSRTQSRQNRVDLVTSFLPYIICEVIIDIPWTGSDFHLGSCLSSGWQGRWEQSWLAHIGFQTLTLASLTQWWPLHSPSHMPIFTLDRRNSTIQCLCFCAITINKPFLPMVKNFPIWFSTLLANRKLVANNKND